MINSLYTFINDKRLTFVIDNYVLYSFISKHTSAVIEDSPDPLLYHMSFLEKCLYTIGSMLGFQINLCKKFLK